MDSLQAQPPAILLEEARLYCRAAHFDKALARLDGCEDWPTPLNESGVLLKADIAIRRDPVVALGILAGSHDLFTTDEGRFGYLIASAHAYANSRNFDIAADVLHSAQEMLPGANPSWEPKVASHRVRLAWMMRDFDPNSEDVQIALRDPEPNARFFATAYRGWMHAGLGEYTAQIRDFIECLEIADANPNCCDTQGIAATINALLRLALELRNDEALAAAERAFERLVWTPDIQVQRFQCVRALAWDAFLRGESAKAQWLLKDSKDIAPTSAWKVMAHVDRAYVAHMNLNEMWAREELYQAHKLARSVSWSATFNEERLALVTMAILFAPIDMALAQHYVSLYIQLGTETVNPSHALPNEPRVIALEKYATGRVQQVLGNTVLATKSFETAYETFSRANYHYRAALAAQGLAEVTGLAIWTERARKHASYFPNSAVYDRLNDTARQEKENHASILTQMQRQIAIAFCDGLEADELSRRFSRSVFTINKQLEAIYASLGVRSRNQMRTELQRCGVL